jgi:hypothetical protein
VTPPDQSNRADNNPAGDVLQPASGYPTLTKPVELKPRLDRGRRTSIATVGVALGIWLFSGIWVIELSMSDLSVFMSNGCIGWSAPLGPYHWAGKGFRFYPCSAEMRSLFEVVKVRVDEESGGSARCVRIPLWVPYLVIVLLAMLPWRGAKMTDLGRYWPVWRAAAGAFSAVACHYFGPRIIASLPSGLPIWLDIASRLLLFAASTALAALPLRSHKTVAAVCVGGAIAAAYIGIFSMQLGPETVRSMGYAFVALLSGTALYGVGFGLPLALVVYLHNRSWPIYQRGCCSKCGYNLTGLKSIRCPECGTEFDSSDAVLMESTKTP